MKKYCSYCMSKLTDGEKCPNCGLSDGSYQPNPYHIPPGTVLKGRYLVGRVLGEGGFGITYIGCDLQLEMRVAIKEYYPQDRVSRTAAASLNVTAYVGELGRSYEKGKSKFLEEARVMAKLTKEPSIVRVQDFFEDNNTAYIVMEYIEGTNLGELVEQKGGKIPPEELFPLVEPLFKAMQTMHEMGLLHRDISPDNIMIEGGKVRLLDFGCAREAISKNETLTIQLKHGYAPIEQYQQKGQGPWTDVYAFSATLYFCLTGRKPPSALDRIAADNLLRPTKLGVNITEKQEKALLRGLRVQQNRRTQSMQELHSDLYNDAPAEETGSLLIIAEPFDEDGGQLSLKIELSGENLDKSGVYGDIELEGGVCETSLISGGRIELLGLPAGTEYKIICEEAEKIGLKADCAEGIIEKGIEKTASFGASAKIPERTEDEPDPFAPAENIRPAHKKKPPNKKAIAAIAAALALVLITASAAIAAPALNRGSLPSGAIVLYELDFEFSAAEAEDGNLYTLVSRGEDLDRFFGFINDPGRDVFLDFKGSSPESVNIGFTSNSSSYPDLVVAECAKNGKSGFAASADSLKRALSEADLRDYAVDLYVSGDFPQETVKGKLYILERGSGLTLARADVVRPE